MFVNRAVKLVILATTMLWPVADAGTTGAVKLCGRKLSDIMSRVCYAYNSPSISVLENHGTARQKRHIGIADQCCMKGCTWEQLNEYCAISADSEPSVAALDTHMIADRSAEGSTRKIAEPASGPASPAVIGGVVAETETAGTRREVGRGRSRGYGRARAKGRRCRCRRKRRSDRRRSFLMGNMGLIKNVVRAAPMVGTVSPLLTWGRTLNTDFPPMTRDRYAYIVYA